MNKGNAPFNHSLCFISVRFLLIDLCNDGSGLALIIVILLGHKTFLIALVSGHWDVEHKSFGPNEGTLPPTYKFNHFVLPFLSGNAKIQVIA